MITKYNEFLTDQMINESEVVFSKKFRKLLNDIESPVSEYLIDIENDDIDVFSNYFDISDTKDAISFIPDKKAQEILGDDKKQKYVIYDGDGGFLTHNKNDKGEYNNAAMFTQLGYVPSGNEPYHPDGGDRGEVISKATSRTTGKIYLYIKFSEGECVINEERISYDDSSNEVWTKNRQQIRIGRGIRALLNAKIKSNKGSTKFSDSEIEDFVNKYKSCYDKMNDIFSRFELVSGDEIAHWYSRDNYLDGGSGQLGNSCMAGVPKGYFKIYTANPEVCSLLILKDESDDTKIRGRALVWKLKTPTDVTFMDRIYTNQDSDMQLFKDYSKLKKWEYKKHNDSSPEGETIDSDGISKHYSKLSVFINTKTNYKQFPYVDTLKNFCRDSGELTTDEDLNSICLEDTSGGYSGSECDECGGSGTVECWECDGNGEYDCGECDGTGKQECDDCGGDGKIDDKPCNGCDGRGENNCDDCRGRGIRTCHNCGGDGRVDCRECN